MSIPLADAKSRMAGHLLPPRALLLSLLAQLPLLVGGWPPAPGGAALATGGALIALGLALEVWSDRLFQRNGVGVCPFTPVSRLVDSGPYRFTRNPMYLGLVAISGGAALASGVLPNLWTSLVLALWLDRRFVRREEAFLRAALGPAYAAYARRVPRWLGWPRRRLESDHA